jgi:hypothetical protein
MSALFLTVQGLRIHAGFYRHQGDWRLDPVDTYVVDKDGRLVWEIDDTDRLGALDVAGRFQSLRCLAEAAVNDDIAEAWEQQEDDHPRTAPERQPE